MDVSGGVPSAHTPIQALILPERVVVSSGDDVKTYLAVDTKKPLFSIHEEDRLRPPETDCMFVFLLSVYTLQNHLLITYTALDSGTPPPLPVPLSREPSV